MTDIEYAPPIIDSRIQQLFAIGDFLAVLHGEIKSEGPVEYLYVLSVHRAEDNTLRLCVASEKNNVPMEGAGSHFLGVFPGDGHENLGLSDEWADRDRFTARALSIAKERLGIVEDPVEIRRKRPWWKFWGATV
jgi:hypothetical protein